MVWCGMVWYGVYSYQQHFLQKTPFLAMCLGANFCELPS